MKYVMCLCLFMGMAAAQEPSAPSPPPTMTLYQQYLTRLLQINAEIMQVEAEITMLQVQAVMFPNDPFIPYQIDMLYGRLFFLQLEQTEVRFILSTQFD